METNDTDKIQSLLDEALGCPSNEKPQAHFTLSVMQLVEAEQQAQRQRVKAQKQVWIITGIVAGIVLLVGVVVMWSTVSTYLQPVTEPLRESVQSVKGSFAQQQGMGLGGFFVAGMLGVLALLGLNLMLDKKLQDKFCE